MEKYEINKYLEKFENSVKDLNLALDTITLETRLKELNEQILDPNFWDDSKKSNKVISELNVVKEKVNTISEVNKGYDDILELYEMYTLDESDEMKELLEWNPGMKSRIAFHVSFDDYTENELLDITKLLAKERGMKIDKKAEEKLLSIYADARKDKAFGNGRFARNLLEKAKFNQANRFMQKDLRFVSDDEICTLVADDFDYEVKKEETRPRLGFGV